MKSEIKDAKPGERWEACFNGHRFEGTVIVLGGMSYLAYRLVSGGHPSVTELSECHETWTKVANADGTPYEEPKPLPEFGECWAARDYNGLVYLSDDQPTKMETIDSGVKIGHFMASESVYLGKISFRPDLPWDKTACKVRVRLEVVE